MARAARRPAGRRISEYTVPYHVGVRCGAPKHWSCLSRAEDHSCRRRSARKLPTNGTQSRQGLGGAGGATSASGRAKGQFGACRAAFVRSGLARPPQSAHHVQMILQRVYPGDYIIHNITCCMVPVVFAPAGPPHPSPSPAVLSPVLRSETLGGLDSGSRLYSRGAKSFEGAAPRASSCLGRGSAGEDLCSYR